MPVPVPTPRKVFLEVVDHEEYVEFEKSGSAPYVKIDGSETAFLNLRLPNGKMVRVEIAHGNLDDVLALMFPEDFDPDSEWNRSLRGRPPASESPE